VVVDHLFPGVESFFKKSDVPPWPVCPVPFAVTEKLKQLRKDLALTKTVSALEKRKKAVVDEEMRDRIETTIGYLKSFAADMDDFIEQGDKDKVYYAQSANGGMELKSSLVESGNAFENLMRAYTSVIMTSATLTSGENFFFPEEQVEYRGFLGKRLSVPPLIFRLSRYSISIKICRSRITKTAARFRMKA